MDRWDLFMFGIMMQTLQPAIIRHYKISAERKCPAEFNVFVRYVFFLIFVCRFQLSLQNIFLGCFWPLSHSFNFIAVDVQNVDAFFSLLLYLLVVFQCMWAICHVEIMLKPKNTNTHTNIVCMRRWIKCTKKRFGSNDVGAVRCHKPLMDNTTEPQCEMWMFFVHVCTVNIWIGCRIFNEFSRKKKEQTQSIS